MSIYMLDTNIVSHIIKSNKLVIDRLISKPIQSLCISSITQAELHFGLAKRPEAKKLHQLVHEFLLRVNILAWDSSISEIYGITRASLESKGINIGSFDLLIATHALSIKAILVTNDKAFSQILNLQIEDWTM